MYELSIDPAHPSLQELADSDPIIKDVWDSKYRRNKEKDLSATFLRVSDAIARGNEELADRFYAAMNLGLLMPGGRIIAGAGSGNRVTLMNCYVSPDIPDDMEGIADAHKVARLTQQQGGGIGMDFSTLRPRGAILRRTGSVASGPLPFMDEWDSMCTTIRSAGDRRGAMMGTMCDTHPDILEFVNAKHTKGRLTNFNVSVLASDAFMGAVQDDMEWELYFHEPPADTSKIVSTFEDDNGVVQYVYQVVKARTLFDQITASTYVYSEPGIIFIDRINELNNLKYIEHIHCTNPCGEQPLPANGTCNLGAANLARMVRNPFKANAEFDFQLLRETTRLGVEFLDNVIEETLYPVEDQKLEEFSKRRLGFGVSGLADCLAQLGIRYGSGQAVQLTREIMKTECIAAYERSCELGKELGSFPAFDASRFFGGFAGQKLPPHLVSQIQLNGLRNGVILTIAPTGTTSILFGNISSGIEPIFKLEYTRNVRQNNEKDFKPYPCVDYAYRLYQKVTGSKEVPAHVVETDGLNVEEHVRMQAACQEWIDASVSKTINLPEEISFEDFQQVYSLAYERGCKGCTTYRPSEVRGSILSDTTRNKRPEALPGFTYKINWPSWESAIYVTINEFQGKPYEVFISSKDARYQEWIIALSVLISIIVRKADEPMAIISELKQIQSTHDSAFLNKKRYGSLLARIAEVLENHLLSKGATPVESKVTPDVCPKCLAHMVRKEGCSICPSCSYSTCG